MAPYSGLINKIKNKVSALSTSEPAQNATTGPVTLSLSKRSPTTASDRVAAGDEDNVATVSEKDAFAIANAHVSHLRVKYARHFDNFKANTGETNVFDKRAEEKSQPAAKCGTGKVPLVDHGGDLWTGRVCVGTPAQTVTLDFDTGSSDTLANPNVYKPSASSTAKKTGKTFRVAYGDGSNATGDIYLESLTIGGLTAFKQAFGAATKSTLQDFGNQGIAGMAFKSIAHFNADPFFDTLVKQGTAPQNVFAFGLWPEGARLDLGHIAKEAYQGEITYSKVDSSHGFWSTSFHVAGAEGTQTGIIDTGTTLVMGPRNVVAAIYKSHGVPTEVQDGQVYGVYPTHSPPRITFTFNGTPFTISPEALAYQAQGDQTVGGLVGADIGGPSWIIGDTFLQDVYAVFDKGNLQVGFAPKATSSKRTSGSSTPPTAAATASNETTAEASAPAA